MELHSIKIGTNNSFFATLRITFLKADLKFSCFCLVGFMFKQNFPSIAIATFFSHHEGQDLHVHSHRSA